MKAVWLLRSSLLQHLHDLEESNELAGRRMVLCIIDSPVECNQLRRMGEEVRRRERGEVGGE